MARISMRNVQKSSVSEYFNLYLSSAAARGVKDKTLQTYKNHFEQILLYYWDQSTLSEKQLNSMKLELKAIRQLVDMNDVEDLLESVVE